MNDTSPLLILITGLPCTGKTALAGELSSALNLSLIEKDAIKERLFERLGWSDRDWSMKLGRAAFDLLFYFIEIELRAGHSLIAEARFFPQYHLDVFREIQQRCPFRPFVIELVADGGILLQRFQQRSESGERHPGHVDHTSYNEAEALFRLGYQTPFDLGGRYIEINTSDINRVNYSRLIESIQLALNEKPVE